MIPVLEFYENPLQNVINSNKTKYINFKEPILWSNTLSFTKILMVLMAFAT